MRTRLYTAASVLTEESMTVEPSRFNCLGCVWTGATHYATVNGVLSAGQALATLIAGTGAYVIGWESATRRITNGLIGELIYANYAMSVDDINRYIESTYRYYA